MGQTKKEIVHQKEFEMENIQRVTEEEDRKISKLNIPQPVIDALAADLCNLQFDYFRLYDEHNYLILPYLVCYIFDHYSLYNTLKIDPKVLFNLAENIAKGYLALYYPIL